jgi:hypothetical protein
MNTGIYPFNLTLAEEAMEEQLVDVLVAQQASPPRVELPIPVEISSSSPSAEAMNSPEMSLPIQRSRQVLQGHNHLLVMQRH